MRSRESALLSLARESPARVALHDRPGWLSLFASDAVVEDPVGAAPHRRQPGNPEDPLARFYDTFIGPNQVAMDTRLDVVHPQRKEVARDVIIHTTLSTGLAIDVHAYLLYELSEEQGRLCIARLAAHWELPQMTMQVLGRGLAGLWSMTRISLHMLRVQGLFGVLGYMRAMTSGVFGRGRRTLQGLAAALTARDERRLRQIFSDDASVDIAWAVDGPPSEKPGLPPSGDDQATAPVPALLAMLPPGYTWVVSSPLASGRVVAFRYAVSSADGSPGPHGIGFCEFASAAAPSPTGRGPQISRLRLFVSSDAQP